MYIVLAFAYNSTIMKNVKRLFVWNLLYFLLAITVLIVGCIIGFCIMWK